jgi:plasmid stabilization system protein ParE
MVTKIIWTKAADKKFDTITAYLQEKASLQVAQNFAKLVYEKIDLVVKFPTLGKKLASSKSIRVLTFGKNHQLYYRIEGKSLIISNFFDTRQDPKKRPF